jgi:hypothetical protein
MANLFAPAESSAHPSHPEISCSSCPCGSVCVRWRNFLVLHMDYAEVLSAIRCLEDVLAQSAQGFSLGENTFCGCRAADGRYYLLCHDRVVIRMNESEAKELRERLCESRHAMEKRTSIPTQVM